MADRVRRIIDEHGGVGRSSIEFERVPVRRLSRGDRILVRPGERVPVKGDVVAVVTDPGGDMWFGAEEDAPGAGDVVGPDGTVRDASVIIEVRGRPLLWWLRLGALGGLGAVTRRESTRWVISFGLLALVFLGTGLGGFNPIAILFGDAGSVLLDDRPPNARDGQSRFGTPGAIPTVTVTPPADTTATPAGERTTTPGAGDTPTPAGTTTPAGTAADTNGSDAGGASYAPSLSVAAADPPPIASPNGSVGVVDGRVGGRLAWTKSGIDSVVLVLQVWVPGQGWTERARELVRPDATATGVDLGAVFGETTYARPPRSAAFANPVGASTRRTPGRVAVTAVLFADHERVASVTASDGFNVTVTNERFDLELSGTGSDGGAALRLTSEDDVMPAAGWTDRGTLTNTGNRAGEISLVDVDATSFEHGLTEAEREAGDTGGDPGAGAGELLGALEVRVSVVNATGARTYVFGDASTYRPFADLLNRAVTIATLAPNETVTLVLEYRVAPEAGNEIQTDGLEMDFTFRMVAV